LHPCSPEGIPAAVYVHSRDARRRIALAISERRCLNREFRREHSPVQRPLQRECTGRFVLIQDPSSACDSFTRINPNPLADRSADSRKRESHQRVSRSRAILVRVIIKTGKRRALEAIPCYEDHTTPMGWTSGQRWWWRPAAAHSPDHSRQPRACVPRSSSGGRVPRRSLILFPCPLESPSLSPPLPLSTPRPTSTHPDADHSPFHTPRCVPMWLRALRSRQHNGALSPRATLHPRFTPDEATEPAEAYRLIRADDAFCRYIRRLTDARATILVQRLGSMMAARYLPSSARHGGMLDQKETSGGP